MTNSHKSQSEKLATGGGRETTAVRPPQGARYGEREETRRGGKFEAIAIALSFPFFQLVVITRVFDSNQSNQIDGICFGGRRTASLSSM